jgi:phage anti-repressor protein
MTFFYDLNKRMAELANKQTLAEGKSAKPDFLDIDRDGDRKEPMKKAAKEKNIDEADYSAKKASAGKDIGKPGKAFGTIAKDAAKRYGSKEAGERVAGAVLKKLRAKEDVNEADVEEGNEFSGALAKAKASGATEFEVDGKKYKVTTEGFKELDAYMAKKKKEAGTGKFDKKQISTGTVYTRKHEEEDEDDEEDNDAPKKKGRKEVGTGRGKKIGAKVKGTSKLASKGSIAETYNRTKDDLAVATSIIGNLMRRSNKGETINPKELVDQLKLLQERVNRLAGGPAVDTLRPETKPMAEDNSIALVDKGEYDREGDMALNQLHQIEDAAEELHSILDADENLPEWVQSKITKAVDYIDTARDYMKAKKQQYTARGEIAEPVAEKAVSKQQQKFMGMAHAMQKGEKIKGASAELKKVAKSMKKSDVEDFAATKHKGLPKKVKEADAEPKAKKTGGIEFGKGIYESINSRVEKMITEGMNVSVNMSTNEHGELTKNITVSAEGDEAESLAQLLNLAGMKSSSCGCGQTPCGCNTVEEAYGDTDPTENKPDYPTEEEITGEDDELLRRWAGGLNKPKSTGQTTIPVIASQTDRQVSEQAKTDKLGMNLYAELKSFKVK